MVHDDTIVAISSAAGASARMIVRMSGAESDFIARTVVAGTLPDAQTTSRARLRLGERSIEIPATIYRFAAPRSATGEDVIEVHIPGNPLLARMLIEQLVKQGARQAEPGEFTARAFFNRRIGLTQAEGIGALIAAQNDAQLDAARSLMSGELARRLAPTMEALAHALALLEAGIDFSDEPVSFVTRDELAAAIHRADESLCSLLAESPRMERLWHEPQIVLAGRPNAGKSTLLNSLAGIDRAIVSPQSGTTRDALSAIIRLNRGYARLIDIAGIEEAPGGSVIDAAMQSSATKTIESADVIVLLIDSADPRPPPALARPPQLTVRTKIDRGTGEGISAKTGHGLGGLRDRLDELCFGGIESARDAAVALTARHLHAIGQSRAALAAARADLDAGPEILALDLREALEHLGSILGRIDADQILGRIFATFCIGK